MIDYSRLNFLAGWLTEERFREIWKRGREEMKKQGKVYPAWQFCRMIGVSERTFRRWLSGATFPDKHSLLLLDEGMKQIFGPDWIEEIDQVEVK